MGRRSGVDFCEKVAGLGPLDDVLGRGDCDGAVASRDSLLDRSVELLASENIEEIRLAILKSDADIQMGQLSALNSRLAGCAV